MVIYEISTSFYAGGFGLQHNPYQPASKAQQNHRTFIEKAG
jgi:hypothetical protein